MNYVPWYNTKFSVQYTYYNKFNGDANNYDGSGRHATDNNTLMVMASWLMLANPLKKGRIPVGSGPFSCPESSCYSVWGFGKESSCVGIPRVKPHLSHISLGKSQEEGLPLIRPIKRGRKGPPQTLDFFNFPYLNQQYEAQRTMVETE